MGGSRLQRWTAWLCVVAALGMGVAPAQRLVLCVEPGEGIAVELASEANRCGGCPDACDDAGEIPAGSAEAGCSCIDIPLVPDSRQDQVAVAKIELPGAAVWNRVVVRLIETRAGRDRARLGTPRQDRALASIRSVVLRV